MNPNRTALKRATIFTVISGIGWIGYNTQSVYKTLSNLIDPSIIDYLDNATRKYGAPQTSKYIYVQNNLERSSSLIDRFWDSIMYTYARRLLSIAQSDDKITRCRAVTSLAEIRNLDNWHYSLLAHMCDARTAVGLARSKNVDLKIFFSPPCKYIWYNHEKIVKWMKHFLIALNARAPHPCLVYFLDKAFVNIQDVGRMVEHDISSTELAKCIQSADDILPMCVQSILHHSTIDTNARDIVMLNGLPLLMEIYKRFDNNTEVLIALAKIMANISIYPELLQDIYKSGWIGVLAKLLRHNDIRIQGAAAKALANLDVDDHETEMYGRKIYLLHPIYRTSQQSSVDVVLVHGLLGGVFFTWRQRDTNSSSLGLLGKKKRNESISMADDYAVSLHTKKPTSDPQTRQYLEEIEEQKQMEWDEIGKDFEFVYHDCPLSITGKGPYSCAGASICSSADFSDQTQCWPKDWLPQDCSNIRVLGINYSTYLSMWAPMCPTKKGKSTLDERSDEFLLRLGRVGLGNRPIVWISHSMGGLLVKNLLVKAWESKDDNLRNLCNQSKGIVFYSTPHKGSHAATINQAASIFLWPSIEVRELKEGSPALLKLHDKFLEMLKEVDIKIISFVETESTIISPLKLNFHFVEEESAKMNVGEYYEIPLDHLRICKPLNRSSFLYQKIVHFIETVVKGNRAAE